MTVKTTTWTRLVTTTAYGPTSYTETETEHLICPPGVVDDPATLPLINNVTSLAYQYPNVITSFSGIDLSNAVGKAYSIANGGTQSRALGRMVKPYTGVPASPGEIRQSSTVYLGQGLSTEMMTFSRDPWGATGSPHPLLGELPTMNSAANRITAAYSNGFMEVTKPAGEFWSAGALVVERTLADGSKIYSTSQTLGTALAIRLAGRVAATVGVGPTTAFIQWTTTGDMDLYVYPGSQDIDQGQVLSIKATAASVFFGNIIYADVTRTNIAGFVSGAVCYALGVLVGYQAPNVFTIRIGPSIPAELTDHILRSVTGQRACHLSPIATFSSYTTQPLYGPSHGNKWFSKNLARDLQDIRLFSEGGQVFTNDTDRCWRTRTYVRAPFLIGSCDGGDFAMDATLPAPFGDVRVVYSPGRQGFGIQATASSTDSSVGDGSATEYLTADIFNYQSFLCTSGQTFYEPFLVEKISTVAAVPSGYVVNKTPRVLGRVRSTREPNGALFPADNRLYGGDGAWEPTSGRRRGLNNSYSGNGNDEHASQLVHLDSIPAAVPVTVGYTKFSFGIGAPGPTADVGWCLWDAVTQQYVLTGGTSTLTRIDSAAGVFGQVDLYQGVMPAPPTGNRVTELRAYVSVSGIGSITGAYFNIIQPLLAFGSYPPVIRVMLSGLPTRRRIWPTAIFKNENLAALGDPDVQMVENLGAVWQDPTPAPIVTSTGDWTPSLVGSRIRFTGTPIWTVTNRALSPETPGLETYRPLPAPTYYVPLMTYYRIKIVGPVGAPNVGLWIIGSTIYPRPAWQPLTDRPFTSSTPGPIYFELAALPAAITSGTELEIEICHNILWTERPPSFQYGSVYGTLFVPNGCAQVWRRKYLFTRP